MYRKDQLVFYGNTGVCRVADVAPLPQQKDGRLYYTLIPLFSPFSETIHVSVSTRAFMRPVISAAEAKSYLDNISHISAEPFRSRDHKETANHYSEMLNTHDCMQYLQLMKSLYRKIEENARVGKHISQTEQRYLKQAETLLYGELAAALGKEPGEIRTEVQQRFAEEKQLA